MKKMQLILFYLFHFILVLDPLSVVCDLQHEGNINIIYLAYVEKKASMSFF